MLLVRQTDQPRTIESLKQDYQAFKNSEADIKKVRDFKNVVHDQFKFRKSPCC